MNSDMQLLIECCSVPGCHMEAVLNESVGKNGLTRFRGKFQEADAVNKNKRSYPFAVLDENVKKLNETIATRGLIGECDHPADSVIHLEKASHVVTKLWWEGSSLMGEGEILSTPAGEILKALINSGVRVGISSRGVGSGKVDESGVLVIGESYKLITFDAVADPSTHAAFQQKVAKENYAPKQNNNTTTKTAARSISTVTKEAVIACLGGVISQRTGALKAKL